METREGKMPQWHVPWCIGGNAMSGLNECLLNSARLLTCKICEAKNWRWSKAERYFITLTYATAESVWHDESTKSASGNKF